MKKVIAVLLTLTLVISLIPGTAFGSQTGDTQQEKTPLTEAMVKLAGETSALYSGKAANFPDIQIEGFVKDTDYTVTWSPISSNPVNAGIYTAAVEAKPEGRLSGGPVIKRFEIKKVDFAKAVLTYKGTTEKKAFSGFDSLAAGEAVVLQNGVADTVVIQDGKQVDTSLYDVTAVKLSANSIRVTAALKKQDENTTGTPIFDDFNVTTGLDGAYQIIGTGPAGTIPDQEYSGGAALEPVVYVVPAGQTTTAGSLRRGIDYTLSYANNTKGGQTAVVTATGINGYSGQISRTFAVKGKDIGRTNVQASNAVQGKAPDLTVKDGSAELKPGVDYIIQSYDSSRAGTGQGVAVIEGMGNYSGTKTVTYNVVSESNQITSADVSLSSVSPYYNASVQPANVTVKKGTAVLQKGRDYEVIYSYNDGTKAVTTTAPKDAKVYSVYVKGTGNYATAGNSGSLYVGSYTIRQVPLDWAQIVLGSATVLYNGVSVPKVSLRHISGSFFFPESDYKVTYRYLNSQSSYLKPTVAVVPAENGNLTVSGSTVKELTKEFSLAARKITNCIVKFSDNKDGKDYDGRDVRPSVTVRDGGLNKTLTLNTDYTVTYKDAKGKTVNALRDAGTYTVIITGTGIYTGTVSLSYTIYGTDISRYTVNLRNTSVSAGSGSYKPVIDSVTYGTKKLTAADYEVSYLDSDGKIIAAISSPGTYRVVITGKNGYSGSTYALYRVIGKAQTIKIEKTAYKVYTSTEPFRISAKATGDGTGFTYVSNNPEVASVSAGGVVTVHKLGRAVITVTTAGDKKYEPVSDQVYVKVHPLRTKISKKPWKDGKAAVRVRWDKQEDVTKYQIRYARNKTFRKGTYKTKTVEDLGLPYETQSTKLSGLKRGQRYYVKVRAIKEVYNEKGTKITYYGNWSLWRSVVVK